MNPRTKPLTRCEGCASPLIYARAAVALEGGRVAIDRRCPECERHDRVVASSAAVAAWARRERRVREHLVGIVLMREVDAILASAPSHQGS